MKKSQLDRAIDALEQKQEEVAATARVEIEALECAITTMKAQRPTKRSKGPKAVVAEKASA